MNSSDLKPLVVVHCITYNQEKYIGDALNGFVMQQTNFPFVVVVHDDASTDRTATIIREYADRYPNIIKPIFENENIYSRKDGSLTRIMTEACSQTGAKYIAFCEGDDYWTDSGKLQKQFDFLEANNDYSFCGHNVKTKMEDGYKGKKLIFDNVAGTYSGEEILTKWIVPTCSVMCRMNVYIQRPINPKFLVGDYILTLTCILMGRYYLFGEEMGVYRLNGGGWTSTQSNKIDKFIDHLEAVKDSFSSFSGFERYKYLINIHIIKSRIRLFENKLFKSPITAIEILWEGVKKDKFIFIRSLLLDFPKSAINSVIIRIKRLL